jgi:hypothetical protein
MAKDVKAESKPELKCCACGIGKYRPETARPVVGAQTTKLNIGGRGVDARVMTCDNCGHMAFFKV